MPRCARAAAVACARVFSPARPLIWSASESPADSSMSPLPLSVTVSLPVSDWVRNTCVSNVAAMFNVDDAASAVSVFIVDAGSRGVPDSCSAATVPRASSTTTETSEPTPSAASSSFITSPAAVASIVLVVSREPAMVPPCLAETGSAKVGASTGLRVSIPGMTSYTSAMQ